MATEDINTTGSYSGAELRDQGVEVCAVVTNVRSLLHAISVMSDDPLYNKMEIHNLALHGADLCDRVVSEIDTLTENAAAVMEKRPC